MQCIQALIAIEVRLSFGSSSSPVKMLSQQDRDLTVTRLPASLLTARLFPDKYSYPLDSVSQLQSNGQEAVCWKDAARNYICLQTGLRSKHALWNKLPSEMKMQWRNKNSHQSILWMLRNACAVTDMRTGIFIFDQILFTKRGIVNESLCMESFHHCLGSVRRSEIKLSVWLGNITMWLRENNESPQRTQTLRQNSRSRQPATLCVFDMRILFYCKCCIEVDVTFHAAVDLSTGKAKPKIYKTQHGFQPPSLSPCQRQQSNIQYIPTQTRCYYQHLKAVSVPIKY